MYTGEAIKHLEASKDIVKLIQELQKYKEMWEDFKYQYGSSGSEMGGIMDKFEEKHFPKGGRK